MIPTNDHRHIDSRLGTLSGEGSHQHVHEAEPVLQEATPGALEGGPSYYGHPLLKQPVWIWSIPLYFYVGGVSGVSATLGAAAQMAGGLDRIVTRTRWIGTIGGALSAALLIHDLGRPERFLNMLRVLRVSSPMSIGSWVLSGYSGAVGAAAIMRRGPTAVVVFGDVMGAAAGVLGLGLSGYTAVLLAQTAVPLWNQTRRTLPFLFLGSATASAASLLELMPLTEREETVVGRFGVVGKTVELTAMWVAEREAAAEPRVGRPFTQGVGGFLWQTAKVLSLASLVLSVWPGRRSDGRRKVAGALGTVAGVALRFGIFHAGKASARDPQATFQPQHSRLLERSQTTEVGRQEPAGLVLDSE